MQTRIKSNHSSQVFNFSLMTLFKEYLLNTFEENVPTGRAVTKLEFFHDIMRLTVKNAFLDFNRFKSPQWNKMLIVQTTYAYFVGVTWMFLTKGAFDKLGSHQKSGYSSWDVLTEGANTVKLPLGRWDVGRCHILTRGDACGWRLTCSKTLCKLT